mmetsp:Transcript_100715/g.288666  ORF Transcript_100715/g.288666 Transcript_100715/m.288666 type:complete len:518 (-) Transcript_100715:310-1863(-)
MKTELVVKKGDGMTADLDDLEKGVEAGTTAAPPAAPKEEPVDLLPLFISLNSFFLKHPGFWRFVARYTFLTALQLSFVASITIGTAVVRIDLDDGLDQQKVYVLGGVIAGSYIIAQIAKPFKTGLMAWYRGNGGTELATAIVAKIFDLPLGAITTTPTGELTQLLASCRPILENVIPGFYGVVIPVVIETLFLVIFLSVAYGYTGLVVLLLFVAYSCVAYVTSLRKSERSQNELKSGMKLFGELISYMNAYERAHHFGNVGYTVAKVHKSFSGFNAERYEDQVGELYEEIPLLIFMGLTHLLVSILIPISMDGNLFQQMAITIYIIAIYLTELQEFANAIGGIRSGVADYKVVREFLARDNPVGDRPGAVEVATASSPEIEFKNVVFSYGERVILDDVSFKIAAGTRLGVVGSSGCGKSTIIKLLLRFYAPTSGSIYVNGQDIYSLSAESLRSLFSVVTQDAQLFRDSIRENIGYGKMGSSDEEVRHAAKLAELELAAEGTAQADMYLGKDCGEKVI